MLHPVGRSNVWFDTLGGSDIIVQGILRDIARLQITTTALDDKRSSLGDSKNNGVFVSHVHISLENFKTDLSARRSRRASQDLV